MSGSLLFLLRQSTGSAHAALEAEVGIEGACASEAVYRALLERFLGFYEPLEGRLRRVGGWSEFGIDLGAREKSPWLRADLRALGLGAGTVAALPRCADGPAPATLAEAFGCAYVLEGSTLGGRQISGMLAGGPIPAEARSFFASYRGEVGARWREFCAGLERFGAAGGDAAGVVAGARATFEIFNGWLRAAVPA